MFFSFCIFESLVITQVQWEFSTVRTNSLVQVRTNKSTGENQLEHATTDLCTHQDHQASIYPKETFVDLDDDDDDDEDDESHPILEPDLFRLGRLKLATQIDLLRIVQAFSLNELQGLKTQALPLSLEM